MLLHVPGETRIGLFSPDGMIRIVEIVGLDRQACGGTHLTVQSSLNLSAWTKLSSSTVQNQGFELDVIDDTAASVSRRFYRAVLEP